MAAPERIDVKIGGKLYDISTTLIPYFASYTDFQSHSGHTSQEHNEIPSFEAAYQGAEKGFRYCFRNLDTDLSAYHTLCDTLDFLRVDTLGGRSIDAIIEDLKSGEGHHETDYKRSDFMKGDKATARDSAFRLLYVILRGELEDDIATSQKFYNAVIFVVSHRAIFKYRARKMIRAAYEERISASKKQMATLDQWPVLAPTSTEWSDGEMTTEDSSSYELDSDNY
ncbi:MAG: hypothetical protein LQ346_008567 [Caloplaca aetnensis]|nr:MAG: hypothetical protein LQ346_008567 [Caloplaca aetnensis]